MAIREKKLAICILSNRVKIKINILFSSNLDEK
jgi:hypothetical protein